MGGRGSSSRTALYNEISQRIAAGQTIDVERERMLSDMRRFYREEDNPPLNNLGQLQRRGIYNITDNSTGETREYIYGGIRTNSAGEEVDYFRETRGRGELTMDVWEFNSGDYEIRRAP